MDKGVGRVVVRAVHKIRGKLVDRHMVKGKAKGTGRVRLVNKPMGRALAAMPVAVPIQVRVAVQARIRIRTPTRIRIVASTEAPNGILLNARTMGKTAASHAVTAMVVTAFPERSMATGRHRPE